MATTVNSTAKDAGRPSCSEALLEGNTSTLEPLGESVGLAESGEDDDEVRDRDATTAVAVDTIGLTQTSVLAESSQAEEPTKRSKRGRPPKKSGRSTTADTSKELHVCSLCCERIRDGKQQAIFCEGKCGWMHRYCAGVSVAKFEELSLETESSSSLHALKPFLCLYCEQ